MGLRGFINALTDLAQTPKTWRDSLRPASFRGVPFYVDGSQFTGGRRVSFHEFPDRDNPYPEDLGKAGHTFKVDGHILGDDYFEIKKRLMEAVDKPGPGELIHPFFGTLSVQCGVFAIDEDTKEGGFAKISFQFYESGSNAYPKAIDDKRANLLDAAANAKTKSMSAFEKAFSIAKTPGHIVATARTAVRTAATIFENATKGVVSTIEGVADLAYGIRNLRAEVDDLLAAPGLLASRLSDSFDLLADAIGTDKEKVKAASLFFTFGSDTVLPTAVTPSRIREADNKAALDKFMRRTAVANAVIYSASAEYDSVDEATKARNTLRDQIEDLLLITEDDEVFNAFKDLNAQLVRVLPDVDSDLPSARTVHVDDTIPAIVLAYDLFENAEAETDLIERNDIRNPCFVPGNSDLEVIDNV
jgi:prophage DNA circulation protein